MTVNEFYEYISNTKPKSIYISGKTSTGKTTFSKRIQCDFGYKVLELDDIAERIIVDHNTDRNNTFNKIFGDKELSLEKRYFYNYTKKAVDDMQPLNSPIVVEGSISDVDTVKRVLDMFEDIMFVYFHPINIDVYVRNLIKRFEGSNMNYRNGLPPSFWQKIDSDEYLKYCDDGVLTTNIHRSIEGYALESQQASLGRLKKLGSGINGIIKIEI